MANSKIEITLISIPSLNQYIKFKVNGVQTTETYKVARTTNFEVLRSADTVIENMANYISAFNLDYNTTGDYIINLIIGETVYIKIESTLSTVNFSDFESDIAGISYTITNTYTPPAPPTVLTPQLAQVRYTYSLRVIPNLPFVTADLLVYAWQGDKNSPSTLPVYSLSKQVVQLGQTVCSFDINHIAKEYINNSIGNYTLDGVQDVLADSNVWLKYSASCDSDPVYETEGLLLATYGYGYFQEGYNPSPQTKALITGDKFTIYKDQDYRVYFQTTGLLGIYVNEVLVPYDFNTDLNYQMIASINLKEYTTASNIVLELNYEDDYTETLNFEVKEECFYDILNCVFINKYGYPQSFFLTKVSKPSTDIEGETYRGLISDFGVYNTTSHQTVSFNVNATDKVKANTDFLNEVENNIIKEMLLSESIWLIENGIINPVVLETKSIDYKQTKVERLIQYEFGFKYAFNTINKV
jgi:hypothetical protein